MRNNENQDNKSTKISFVFKSILALLFFIIGFYKLYYGFVWSEFFNYFPGIIFIFISLLVYFMKSSKDIITFFLFVVIITALVELDHIYNFQNTWYDINDFLRILIILNALSIISFLFLKVSGQVFAIVINKVLKYYFLYLYLNKILYYLLDPESFGGSFHVKIALSFTILFFVVGIIEILLLIRISRFIKKH